MSTFTSQPTPTDFRFYALGNEARHGFAGPRRPEPYLSSDWTNSYLVNTNPNNYVRNQTSLHSTYSTTQPSSHTPAYAAAHSVHDQHLYTHPYSGNTPRSAFDSSLMPELNSRPAPTQITPWVAHRAPDGMLDFTDTSSVWAGFEPPPPTVSMASSQWETHGGQQIHSSEVPFWEDIIPSSWDQTYSSFNQLSDLSSSSSASSSPSPPPSPPADFYTPAGRGSSAMSRRRKQDTSPPKQCSHCRATTTPLWRREPKTLLPLCNACGLYLQQRHKLRPQELIDADADEVEDTDAADRDPSLPECTHCRTHQTSVWRRSKTGEQLCNACGVYLRLRGKPRPLTLRRKRIKPRSKHSPQ